MARLARAIQSDMHSTAKAASAALDGPRKVGHDIAGFPIGCEPYAAVEEPTLALSSE